MLYVCMYVCMHVSYVFYRYFPNTPQLIFNIVYMVNGEFPGTPYTRGVL